MLLFGIDIRYTCEYYSFHRKQPTYMEKGKTLCATFTMRYHYDFIHQISNHTNGHDEYHAYYDNDCEL